MGPTPAEVIRDFSDGVGRPVNMPPYWSYGYQLGKDYNNMDEIETEFIQNAANWSLPVEAVVFGHTIGDDYKDFTIGDDFASLPEFVDSMLHENGLRAVQQFQSAIAEIPGFSSYDNLLENGKVVENFYGKQYSESRRLGGSGALVG